MNTRNKYMYVARPRTNVYMMVMLTDRNCSFFRRRYDEAVASDYEISKERLL